MSQRDDLFLWPGRLCDVKAIEHVQCPNTDLKAVWGQEVIIHCCKDETTEGPFLVVCRHTTRGTAKKKLNSYNV